MSALLQSSLAAALEVVLIGCGIQTLDDLAERIRSDGDRIADYITSSECRRAGYAAVQAAIQRQRKPVMMDAGLQVQAVVAEASHPQQMRSVGSLVRPRWLPGCVTQAAVQTPRSLATGVNVASQTRTTAVKSVAVGEQCVHTATGSVCCGTDSCECVDATTQVKYEIPEKLSIAGVEAFEEQVEEIGARLLQAETENEMLKRDVQGLQKAVTSNVPMFLDSKHYVSYCMGGVMADSEEIGQMLSQQGLYIHCMH